MTHGATDLPEAEQGLPPCGIALSDGLGPNLENVMKVEFTKDWCMNMAKIEARAAELLEGCQMPMEQARELAASEMSESRKALLAAFGAAAAAREQDLRGQYPKAARVLAEEVFSLRAALRQKCAEYDDMKSLLLGNMRNVRLEGERAREVLHRMLEAPTTQIGTTWKDAARQGLALGPNAKLNGGP